MRTSTTTSSARSERSASQLARSPRVRRWARVLVLLWWFLRFDADSLRWVNDAGVDEQMQCEAMAAEYGFLVKLISVRPVYSPTEKDVLGRPKLLGRWQRACFEGPERLREKPVMILR